MGVRSMIRGAWIANTTLAGVDRPHAGPPGVTCVTRMPGGAASRVAGVFPTV